MSSLVSGCLSFRGIWGWMFRELLSLADELRGVPNVCPLGGKMSFVSGTNLQDLLQCYRFPF